MTVRLLTTATALLVATAAAAAEPAELAPEGFGASGSLATTTGAAAPGSAELFLAAPLDFADGQGIRIDGAGPPPRVAAPAAVTVTPLGAAGTRRYCYRIVALDGQGGGSAAAPEACTMTGAGELSATDRNRIVWSPPAIGPRPPLYAVYGRAAGSEYVIGVTAATSLLDFGGAITGWTWTLDWLPQTPPAVAFNDFLVTTIRSGGGTRVLRLAAPVASGVGGVTIAHDDTLALEAMLAAATRTGAATALLGPHCYPVTGPLRLGGGIALRGRGSSFAGQVGSAPRSCLIAQGAGDGALHGMVLVGAFGTAHDGASGTLVGGEVADLDLIAQAVVPTGVFVEDAQDIDLVRLAIRGAASDGVLLTNSMATQTPTRDIRLDRVNIAAWGTSTPDANCIGVDGHFPGAAGGVTISKFTYVTCLHEQGDMFRIGQVGDAMHVVNPFEFAPPWGAGRSFAWVSPDPVQVNGTWSISHPLLTRPLHVANPAAAIGSFVDYAIDSPDTQSANPPLVTGPGAPNIAILDSMNGERRGAARTLGLRNVVHHDRGMAMRFDPPSGLLLTADGTYAAGGSIAGGYIGTSGSAGGGISLTTPPRVGDSLWIADSKPVEGAFATAIPLAWNPALVVTTSTIALANAVTRFGFICDTADPPRNGVYVEAGPAAANYQLVVANNGVVARADTGIGLSLAPWQYRLDVTHGEAAALSMRQADTAQFTAPTVVLNATLPIPDAACAYVAWIKALKPANQTLIQYDQKIGYQRP